MPKFILKGNPIGIAAPQSAFETLRDLMVYAEPIEGRIVVFKDELVKKLKEKKSMFSVLWKRATFTQFEFNPNECVQID